MALFGLATHRCADGSDDARRTRYSRGCPLASGRDENGSCSASERTITPAELLPFTGLRTRPRSALSSSCVSVD